MAQGQLLHIVTFLMLVSSANFSFGENKVNQMSKLRDGFYVFVSFSMPKSLLWDLHQQISKIGGKLLLRGLKNESFKETIAALKLDKDKILKVDINPKAFVEFDVNQVPGFLVLDAGSYDVAYGNVSLSYVLTSFVEEGATKIKSKALLEKLSSHEKN